MTTLPIDLGITLRQSSANATMHVCLAGCVLLASQPLLIVTGLLVKWAMACGGACAATPFGSPRDIILTALAAAAPYLLALLVAAVTWLLASQRDAQPVVEPSPARHEQKGSPASWPAALAHATDAHERRPIRS